VGGLALRLLEQETVPIEFWGWADDPPFPRPGPPHRALWLPRLGVPRTRYPALLQAAMRLRLRLSRASAIHITDPNALINGDRRPLLTTVYDLIPLHQHLGETPAYKRYLARVRSAEALFAISEATGEDVVTTLGVPRDRVILAQPGIPIPAEAELPAPPITGPYFLYVGSPDPHKNLEVLISAMAMNPDLPERLAIVGNWPESSLSDLRARVDGTPELKGRIEHLGYVDEPTLASLYRSATAVVVPSLTEGFGLPVGEAMAAGAPVVHSRLAVLEEVSAGNALTFAATSEAELAACLKRVSGDPRLQSSLRAGGVERARSLTWTGAVERTLAAYRHALGKDRPKNA
jgi:glycosyltransferase involved in cell wall biosynthesis